ncbi:hypothetical protein EF847_22260 [Actinobacteria bacterium YIM 96077]|uniref:Carbon monoxide dehydrogenase n=1 Tax=Phytoactinopolyspora halophila TaxID=1981511 RepID=A0A329QT29_9ACTN|nr:SRPBCC family protein [Phytoactinopolyspora halophila]AYY15008.1 hypothetical protein EF847_22260 [Actinobacteria bacterium YIM 96077]RAW15465.1 hypothetical protein DPM12_09490 [Phytoactinopolyspora halophila]
MQLQHEFTLPIPPEQAWETLLDVERIAPCMPGAALDHVDGDEFSGRVTLKVGPLRLTYRGDARIEDKDESARRLTIAAEGREARGSGTANATVSAALSAVPDGTRVDLATDLALTGKPAQFGRGLVSEVAGTIIGQFAERLSHEMVNGSAPQQVLASAAESPAAAAPDGTRLAGTPADNGASNAAGHGTDSGQAGGRAGASGDRTGDPSGGDSSLDVLSLVRSTIGTRGLVALGGVAAVAVGILLGRRSRSRATPAGPYPQGSWPAVFVIDAGEK